MTRFYKAQSFNFFEERWYKVNKGISLSLAKAFQILTFFVGLKTFCEIHPLIVWTGEFVRNRDNVKKTSKSK